MKNKPVKNKNVTINDLAVMITDGREETNSLAIMVAKGFERVDKKFDEVDKRFDGVDEKFIGIDKRFDKVDERLDHIENILTSEHNSRIERLEDKMPQVQVLLKTNFK